MVASIPMGSLWVSEAHTQFILLRPVVVPEGAEDERGHMLSGCWA